MDGQVKSIRTHRSEEEIKSLLSEFEASDVTAKELCEIYSINEATFSNWRSRYKQRTEGQFIDVSADRVNLESQPFFLEMELPSGTILRFSQRVGAHYIKALL